MRPLLLISLLFATTQIFASELKTWELNHRSTAEMIPLLKPMLEDGAAISGTGYTLIVRSSTENLAQLDTLIAKLDKAPRMLRITVQRDAAREKNRGGVSLSGGVNEPRVKAHSSQRSSADSDQQQLQVLEGHWASISTGKAIPHVTQQVQQGPYGSSISQGIEYQNVESGFEVRPSIVGELVRLDIRPFRDKPSTHDGGVIERHEIVTTINGRPGEWLELGGVTEQQNSEGTGIIYATRERAQLNGNVRIRVDIINP